jgi:hypothetical protein
MSGTRESRFSVYVESQDDIIVGGRQFGTQVGSDTKSRDQEGFPVYVHTDCVGSGNFSCVVQAVNAWRSEG